MVGRFGSPLPARERVRVWVVKQIDPLPFGYRRLTLVTLDFGFALTLKPGQAAAGLDIPAAILLGLA